MAGSSLEELSEGRFQTVLDDEEAQGTGRGRRAPDPLLRQVLHGARGERHGEEDDSTAVARVELLYPWPEERIREILDGYPNLREVAWAQEEPREHGRLDLRPAAAARSFSASELPLRYVGKPARPSPAQGSARYHKEEHAAIVREAFEREQEDETEGVEATQERASSPSA